MTDGSRWKSSFQRYKLAVSGRAVYTLTDENVFICPPACCSFCVYVSTDRPDRPDGASRSLILSRKQRRARIDVATKRRSRVKDHAAFRVRSQMANAMHLTSSYGKSAFLFTAILRTRTVLGSALNNGRTPAKRFVTSVCPLNVYLSPYWFTSLHDSSTLTTFLLCRRLSWLV